MSKSALEQAKEIIEALKADPSAIDQINKTEETQELVKADEDSSKMSGKSGMIRTDTEANQDHKGVHQRGNSGRSGGISEAGYHLRSAANSMPKQAEKHKQTAKHFHQQAAAELKAMPKPNLPKGELDKSDELRKKHSYYLRGVHRENAYRSGESEAGAYNRASKENSGYLGSKSHAKQRAKELHQDNLKELKEMPKPNLPKSEMEKAGIDAGLSRQQKVTQRSARNIRSSSPVRSLDGSKTVGTPKNAIKGVHGTLKTPGQSSAGFLGSQAKSSTMPGHKANALSQAKSKHTQVLNEMKGIKPKLAQNESSKFKVLDKDLHKLPKPTITKSEQDAAKPLNPAPQAIAPSAPQISIPKPGSVIHVKGPIKIESIDKLQKLGYTVIMKHEDGREEELVKAQKGVHNAPTDGHGRPYNTNPGRSSAGSKIVLSHAIKSGKAYAGSTRNPIPKDSPAVKKLSDEAKKEHKEKLSELKSMPKPNLPKAEMEKAGETGYEKGVHTKYANAPGTSKAGMYAKTYENVPKGSLERERLNTRARGYHHDVRHEMENMPKPNLPKTEIKKDAINPDKEADAKLGEKVERDVEEHFKENKEAEEKEGHDLTVKKELDKASANPNLPPKIQMPKPPKPNAGGAPAQPSIPKMPKPSAPKAPSAGVTKSEFCKGELKKKWEPKHEVNKAAWEKYKKKD